MLTSEQALSKLMTIAMTPFSNTDYLSFGGVESKNPMIGEDDEYLVVLDGPVVTFYETGSDLPMSDNNGQTFRLEAK